MIELKDLLSQWSLNVSPRCQLKCGICSLWEANYSLDANLAHSFRDDAFSAPFPFKKMVNIVGGEPFENPELDVILKGLKKLGFKIRLWTNGVLQPEQWRLARPYVDLFMVYLPSVDPEDYQLSTGFASWEEFTDSLTFLKKKQTAFFFSLSGYLRKLV